MASMLRTFRGESFSLAKLKYIKGGWASHYQNVVERFGSRTFITSYEAGNKLSKTYNEFDEDVRKVVAVLQSEHADCETVVVAGENCYATAVFEFAALLSGKILCPMNPLEGAERIEKKIRQLVGPCVCFSTKEGDLPLRIPDTAPARGSFPPRALDRPAIHVFTSGSTGYSKVVEQMESNILSNVDALIEHHRLNQDSVIATPLPLFHVNALGFSLLCSFAVGGHLVLLQSANPDLLFEAVHAERARILSVVPSILNAMLLRAKDRELSSLRYVVTAAAPLSTELAKRFFDRFGVRVIQGYGLSEAVNFSATMPVDLDDELYRKQMLEARYPSIGTELRGNSIRILQPDGGECEEGQEGEIAIQGWNVANGYRNDPSENFESEYLKTGDLGYFVEDVKSRRRFFFVSGRKKDTVKRSGETVSLREIDDLIRALAIKGFDAIAVPFANDFSGEEVGLVCRVEQEDVSEKWRSELLNGIEKKIIPLLRPRVMLSTTEPIRTPSGKPVRWTFQRRFDKYKSAILSPRPFWDEGEC